VGWAWKGASVRPIDELSTDTLVYQAVQRHFRNAVVSHLRSCLKGAFPDTWFDQLRRPFKEEEWQKIISGVELVKAGGNTNRDYQDEFDYLSVNHFFNIFDCHFKILIPDSELPSDEYLPKLRQDVLAWLREIKSVRDPISHPPEQDLAPLDAWRAVDSARRVLRKLHLEKAASKIADIADGLLEHIYQPSPREMLSPVDDTLPPPEAIVVGFVGRQEELNQLRSWFADPELRRWLLAGDGGKGKSSLAYEFAHEIRAASPPNLSGVFWVSAKKRRFDEGAVTEVRTPDFSDLDTLLETLLLAYGWAEEAGKGLEAKRVSVLGLLDQFPSLVVIDDLDWVEADLEDDIHEFLNVQVPQTHSKILITSRRQFIGMGKTCTVVKGLGPEEANSFIDSRLALMELPSELFPSEVRQEILEVCEGSPLYMEDLLRFCKFLPPRRAIETWRSKSGDKVRQYALVREIEMLSPTAKDVLGVFSLLEGSVSVLELQGVMGRSEQDVIEAVDELRKMYLVAAPDIIEGVPAFSVNRNLASLMRSALKESPQKELELRNAIRAVFGRGFGRAQAPEVGDYCRQAHVFVKANRAEDAEMALNTGLEKHPNHPRLLGMLGWVFKCWRPRRTADARSVWERAAQLKARDREMYIHWAAMELDEHEWGRAAEIAELGAEVCGSKEAEDWQLLSYAGYARSKLGQACKFSGDSVRARTELDIADYILSRAIPLAHKAGAKAFYLSRTYRSWVINARERNDRQAMCSRLATWLEWNADAPFARDFARQYRETCPQVRRYVGVAANE
jgi:hypothetical protein